MVNLQSHADRHGKGKDGGRTTVLLVEIEIQFLLTATHSTPANAA